VTTPSPFHSLTFDNAYARLPSAFHDRVAPTPLNKPFLVAFNPDAAAVIGLEATTAVSAEFVDVFAGVTPLSGGEPVAMRYSGHQFGHYVPQLGDGRAILLGQVRNSCGERWDLHLKGAGQTAFSRMGDGRAVLRSCIREYLCGEAMHGLCIPTTRSLCIIGSETPVYRETLERGATLVRMAQSHVRFGSFEIFHHRNEVDNLRTLTEYVIEHDYPEFAGQEDRYLRMFAEVVRRTAVLMAQWQAVGFAHGVMNTDNMSILGLTLDYGPFGFVEEFDPGFICNHSDDSGRYAFDQQASIGYWNLSCLAQALTPLIDREALIATVRTYADHFNVAVHELLCRKLGLPDPTEVDRDLWIGLLDLLAAQRVDYTNFFRVLGGDVDSLRGMFQAPEAWDAWAATYKARISGINPADRQRHMDMVNPKYILRNYLAEAAIRKAEDAGDYREIEKLRVILSKPFDEQPEHEQYALSAPAWGKRLVVSCSS